ncbi:hypothetical protein [Paractinoplanes rishiriensis]|uniref:Uncharacterized protein n=1 Tax=Paractinoplanes rishiriensis TaxID=1050105 RepID=A0A919K6J8_9ACTN|nr:hypothetical protein [Actinoplanes rishiriensis]GIF00575.1 hypothetical protein Ari01nite_80390 [Actinoplanes rishiriensis]
MNKVTRFIAMTGLAFAASTTIGIGAASAANAAPATPSAESKTAAASKDRFGRDRVIGVYRSRITCHRIGNAGEWRNRWDDYRCVPVRVGFHRTAWKLIAEYNRGHHGFPGNWGPNHHQGHGGFPGGGPHWNQKKR